MKAITDIQTRLYQKLCDDLGLEILTHLADPHINEIMLNPNGELWIDTIHQGAVNTGSLQQQQAFAIIHNVAGTQNLLVSAQHPRLEAELPYYSSMQGERFTAVVPPLVSSPCFNIRKQTKEIFRLDQYVQTHRLSVADSQIIAELIRNRKNILVCGGPGSGKTTFTNTLILEAVKTDPTQRFLILEDSSELHCPARNCVSLLSSADISLRDLVHTALRMSPDRILIGEVRGAEALDLLKAWNTGCPGSLCTIHANSAEAAIQRLADLAMEAGLTSPPWNLIKKTVGAVISVKRNQHQQGFIENVFITEEKI